VVVATLVAATAFPPTAIAHEARPASSRAEPGVVTAPARSSAASTYANAAVRATNRARKNHDLRVTKVDACLRRFARKQVRAMIKAGTLFHSDLGKVVAACGLNAAGENVAYGYPTGASVVWDGWMKSPGHRANILNGIYRRIGVVALRDDEGTWYAAQLFGRKA